MKNQIERAERNAEYDDPRSMGNCMKHGDYDGRNIRCPKCERAEPSRGAPNAHDHECGFSGEHGICRCVTCGHTWRRNDLTYSFVDLPLTEIEKLRAGHVVLLEALRAIAESRADADHASHCAWHRHVARAAIEQAERT